MRLVRNEIQTPKRIISSIDRKKPAFIALMTGVGIVIIGSGVFFLAYIMRNYIKENLTIHYRTLQSYGFLIVFIGVVIYLLNAQVLKIPIRNTTFYKLETIVKDNVFDPQRKDDYTKPIWARLSDSSDDWSMTTQVNPPGTEAYIIPQVIIGPGGVFTLWPLGDHPKQKTFEDPSPLFEKASKILSDVLDVPIIPIMVFSTPKVMQIYKKKYKPDIRLRTLLDLGDYFEDRRQKLSNEQIAVLEAKVFKMIKGSRPEEEFFN